MTLIATDLRQDRVVGDVWQPLTAAINEVSLPYAAVEIASTAEAKLALLRDGAAWAWGASREGTGLLGVQSKVPVTWPLALLQPT